MVADNLGYVGPTSPMLGRPLFPNVSTTQPYNFRNGVSMLQLIEQISQAGRELQDEWNDWQLSAKEWGDGIDSSWADFEAQYANDFTNLREQLVALIQQAAASDNIMVWSSAYGSRVPAQSALDDTYDANRLFGLFAGDFDDLTMSPTDFDALEVSPREFDLRSTDAINAVRGDITSNDIWWLKKHGLTFGDLIAQAQQSAASAATSQASAAQSATSVAQSAISASQSQASAAQSATSAAQSATSASQSQASAAQSATSASQSQASAAQSATSAAQSATSATASQTAAAQSATSAATAVSKMPTILTAANESEAQTLSASNPDAWVFYPEAA